MAPPVATPRWVAPGPRKASPLRCAAGPSTPVSRQPAAAGSPWRPLHAGGTLGLLIYGCFRKIKKPWRCASATELHL